MIAYVFQQYPENFTFQLFIILQSLTREICYLKFYCFRKDAHISFKYARHNHWRCPMMGEVSLET